MAPAAYLFTGYPPTTKVCLLPSFYFCLNGQTPIEQSHTAVTYLSCSSEATINQTQRILPQLLRLPSTTETIDDISAYNNFVHLTTSP